MYAAKAAAAAVTPGGSPGPMMSPGSQWGGSQYSGDGPAYGGYQNRNQRIRINNHVI